MSTTPRTEPDSTLLDCYLMGDSSLVVSCGEAWLEAGHRILGVVSPSAAVQRWAEALRIEWRDPKNDYAAFLRERSFDYLFSIVNHRIVPAAVLALPRKGAVNFHDAPLPRYAGIHATSWAIAQGETVHGVSWHLMNETADAGAILQSAQVDIAFRETAESLNLKCYEAGHATFRRLIANLARGITDIAEQDLRQRTHFARHAKPTPACVLPWNWSARALEALVRACQFGAQDNAFGCAKVVCGDGFALVRAARVCKRTSGLAPGTLMEIAPAGWRVATGDGDILLTVLADELGTEQPGGALAAALGLEARQVLWCPNESSSAAAERFLLPVYRAETAWVDRLASAAYLTVPSRGTAASGAGPRTLAEYRHIDISVPAAARGSAMELSAAFLCRIAGEHALHVGLAPDFPRDNPIARAVLAPLLPFALCSEHRNERVEPLLPKLRRSIETARRGPGYLRDVRARYPGLQKARGDTASDRIPIALECVTELESSHGHLARNSVELALRVTRDGAQIEWLHDPQRVSAEDAAGLALQFSSFVANALKDPGARLMDVPLLADADRQKILVDWNQTARAYPQEKCLHELVDEQAVRAPNAIAYSFGEEMLTYRELRRKSSVLAAQIHAQGLGAGDFIGVFMNRSLDLPVTLLGILKAGAAYIPLDPTHPPSRIALMIEDSGLAAVMVDAALESALPPSKARPIVPDFTDGSRLGLMTELMRRPVGPDDVAYMIYTSGSTGRPKGVPIKHGSVVNLLSYMQTTPGIDAHDRILALTTICFDIACVELFLPLVCGACADILTSDVATDGARLRKTLEASDASIVQATPATWRLLLAAGWKGRKPIRIWCGGEALTPQLARPLLERCTELWNCYGPTEATVYATFQRVTDAADISIGRPVANTQAYILDAALQPVPVGGVGELYLAGQGLSPGYHARPELNEQRFLRNPFAREAAASRLYRTGDACRFRSDGRIEYLGRLDSQIKIRGFRVELGEIETVLARRSEVREAVVAVAEDEHGNKKLIAYIVPVNPEDLPGAEALREYLHAHLPAYMIPATFFFIHAMPLSPNGKVARDRLPEAPRISSRAPVRESSVSDAERRVLEIWREFLSGAEIGVQDNFFDVGGDSILLVQMAQRLSREYGREITNMELFQFPTIAAFAGHIAGDDDSKDDRRAVRLPALASRAERRAALLRRRQSLKDG